MNDQLIDRLVAGDLDEGRRRELLDWLDAEPGRWRCCALAFLEAQLWQETFDVVVRRSQDQSGLFGVTPPAAPGRRTWPSLRPISAVAAALLVAFGLGLSAGWLRGWSRAIGPPALSVAHLQPAAITGQIDLKDLKHVWVRTTPAQPPRGLVTPVDPQSRLQELIKEVKELQKKLESLSEDLQKQQPSVPSR